MFEIDNHPWGGGGVENDTTRMFARDKKVHSARFFTKSTNYCFLIQLITGWHLRPIFRLILTVYIYSRYMYDGQDGIEHFDYAHSYGSLYELCTSYRFKDIKTFTNKSAKKYVRTYPFNQNVIV